MPRKKQRLTQIEKEMEEHTISVAQDTIVSNKVDEELFTIDTYGSKRARDTAKKLLDKQTQLSKPERAKISKIQGKKNYTTLPADDDNEKTLYDMWGSDNTVVSSTRSLQKTSTKINKKLPTSKILPGLSYNPSLEDHQDVIAEAVSLERAKLAKDEEENKLIVPNHHSSQNTINNIENMKDVLDTYDIINLTNNTRNTSNSNEDEEEEDDDEDFEYDITSTTAEGQIKKLKTKLTRSQRNKIKLRNEKEYYENKEKQTQIILKSIESLPTIIESIEQEEKLSEHIKKLKTIQQQQKQSEINNNNNNNNSTNNNHQMTYKEAGEVSLSDELNGSLRTLIPKGNRLQDQILWKIDQGDCIAKNRRKRRAYEKPHGRKNIKWIEAVK